MSGLPPTPRTEVLANIRGYVTQTAYAERPERSAVELAAAEARLDRTLAELQSRISKERAARDQLRSASAARGSGTNSNGAQKPLQSVDGPSPNLEIRLRQIRTLTKAYTRLAERGPDLPPPTSSLPALLALQNTVLENAAVRHSVATTHADLKLARERLALEQRDLKDNQALQDALRKRVAGLRSSSNATRSTPAHQSAEESARRRLAAAETQRKASETEARQCTRALARFITTQLSPMLAAEELGGPVAGSDPAITEDDILSGFTAQGRRKKTRSRSEDAPASAATQDLRQQRIDAIWGPMAGTSADFAHDDEGQDHRSEVEAAALEMRDIVQELLDSASQQSRSNTSYVRLSRDSAAARFLVRTNVAVLHHTDARRIRLRDFGRDVDD